MDTRVAEENTASTMGLFNSKEWDSMFLRQSGAQSLHYTTSFYKTTNIKFKTNLSDVLQQNWLQMILYMITLITVFVPTYSVWYVILFRETGVVHRITHSLSYFFLFIY